MGEFRFETRNSQNAIALIRTLFLLVQITVAILRENQCLGETPKRVYHLQQKGAFRMTEKTELTIRSIARVDPEIDPLNLERAIGVLYGRPL